MTPNGRQTGLVAAAFPDAAEAGAAMLRRGGNAVDAACAAAWALSVCEPAESGLGGQTTMLIHLADGRSVVVDGHSHAPGSLTRARVGRRSQRRGIRSTTIPSTAITLAQAQRRYGRLTLADALAPAQRLAEEGYRITALQRRLLRWSRRFFEPGSIEARTFLAPNGGLPEIGSRLHQPALAATLAQIAQQGAEDFYAGRIARDLVMDMEERGGLIGLSDLRELSLPVEREPLEIQYHALRVLSLPPPGGGSQVLLALQLLGREALSGLDDAQWRPRLALATRAAFRERERWPDHPADMTPSLARWLVSPERAERIATGGNAPTPADPLGESGNTTHLCSADAEGNIVSLTQSIQSVFGAKTMHPRLGFVYNNYLSTCPRTPHPYRLGRNCLPQSNAAPTIVLDPRGKPVLALGSAGSRRIASSVVQVLSDVIDRGTDLAAAVAAPRVHALLGGSIWAEESVGEAALQSLRQGFSKVRCLQPRSYKLGAVQALAWDTSGQVHGAADPRRDGSVAHA